MIEYTALIHASTLFPEIQMNVSSRNLPWPLARCDQRSNRRNCYVEPAYSLHLRTNKTFNPREWLGGSECVHPQKSHAPCQTLRHEIARRSMGAFYEARERDHTAEERRRRQMQIEVRAVTVAISAICVLLIRATGALSIKIKFAGAPFPDIRT